MVRITCVTENTAQPSSPFWGEHGLAFLIESERTEVDLLAIEGNVLRVRGLDANNGTPALNLKPA